MISFCSRETERTLVPAPLDRTNELAISSIALPGFRTSHAQVPLQAFEQSQGALMEQNKGHFRIIANMIFGTQLAFLEVLAQRQPVERQVVKFCYDLHRKRCFERGMICDSFDEWAGYLITSGLIEENQGGFTLTDSGRDFILNFAPANSLNMKTRIL